MYNVSCISWWKILSIFLQGSDLANIGYYVNSLKKRNLYKKFTPNNTKEIILDAGHCPHDEIPELVNQHILDWVDSL